MWSDCFLDTEAFEEVSIVNGAGLFQPIQTHRVEPLQTHREVDVEDLIGGEAASEEVADTRPDVDGVRRAPWAHTRATAQSLMGHADGAGQDAFSDVAGPQDVG